MLGWRLVAIVKESLKQQEQHKGLYWRKREVAGASGWEWEWERWGQWGEWRGRCIHFDFAGHLHFPSGECNNKGTNICLDCTLSPGSTLSHSMAPFLLQFPSRWSTILTLDFLWGPILRNIAEKPTHNELGGCYVWKVCGRPFFFFNKISLLTGFMPK